MSLPDMSGAFWNLTEPVQFNVVKTTAVDFEAVDTLENQIVFDGHLQPLPARELMIKPEGERKFKYWNLWTEQELKMDAIVQDEEGAQYRVLKKTDWRTSDFQQYEIVQAPNPPYSGINVVAPT